MLVSLFRYLLRPYSHRRITFVFSGVNLHRLEGLMAATKRPAGGVIANALACYESSLLE